MSKIKNSAVYSAALKYFLIALGALIYAAGFDFLLYPNDVVSGGVTGIAMILNKLAGLPIGIMTIVINIPLFFVAWRKFGLKFIIDSLLGMVLSSVFVDLLTIPRIALTDDPLLACIIGGVIKGFGFGVIYWEGATTGAEKQVLMCVVRRSQSVEIRRIVKNADPDAFLIVTDAKNVFGRGFGDITDLS